MLDELLVVLVCLLDNTGREEVLDELVTGPDWAAGLLETDEVSATCGVVVCVCFVCVVCSAAAAAVVAVVVGKVTAATSGAVVEVLAATAADVVVVFEAVIMVVSALATDPDAVGASAAAAISSPQAFKADTLWPGRGR